MRVAALKSVADPEQAQKTDRLLEIGPHQRVLQDSKCPTCNSVATEAGVILGTAAYMSPEQARGKEVDKRADIWAFGCVLYEMVTGKRAFTGENTADILAAVVKTDPDLTRVPIKVQRLIEACLRKDPKQRLRDIGDAWKLLQEDTTANGAGPIGHPVRERSISLCITTAASAVLATALIAVSWIAWRAGRSIPEDVVRLTMETAPAEMLGPEAFGRPSYTSVALSPDGKTVVFSGVSGAPATPQVQLYKRTLDQPNAIPLAGTAGAQQPFFSPDGQWVGFGAGGKLKKIPLAGGPPLAICDAPAASGPYAGVWGASWSPAGSVAYVARFGEVLMEAPATGGTPKVLVQAGPTNLYSADSGARRKGFRGERENDSGLKTNRIPG